MELRGRGRGAKTYMVANGACQWLECEEGDSRVWAGAPFRELLGKSILNHLVHKWPINAPRAGKAPNSIHRAPKRSRGARCGGTNRGQLASVGVWGCVGASLMPNRNRRSVA